MTLVCLKHLWLLTFFRCGFFSNLTELDTRRSPQVKDESLNKLRESLGIPRTSGLGRNHRCVLTGSHAGKKPQANEALGKLPLRALSQGKVRHPVYD